MNLKKYLDLKKINAQKELDRPQRIKCLKCFRPQKICFCDQLTPFSTRNKFCILMHPMEAKRERITTGRLTHILLENSQIEIGLNFTHNKVINNLIEDPEYTPVVLYPGPKSTNISNTPLKPKKYRFFVIDGTWPHAKKMMREGLNLQKLPRVSFNPETISQFHIKQQPGKYCLSTIESVHILLKNLEKWGHESLLSKKDELPKALKKLVDFQVQCAQDPNLPSYRFKSYRPPKERTESAKWTQRCLYYDEENYS